jgi:PAS domain S-box-containing protein
MEKRYYHRDGSIVWVLLSVSAVSDDEGTVEYFISQLQDITEQQKAKEALHESEARNAAILEASQDRIISIDEDTRIIDFNPAAAVTVGYTAEDVIGKSITDLIIPPRLREAHRKGMARYKLTGNSKMLNKRVRLTAVRANGIEFPIEMVVQPIEMNRRTLFTAYLRDITERDAFEKALIEAKDNAEETSHLKSSFLNNISHEIRTPLTAIIGFSSILESEVEEEQREMVGLIEHSGKRLLNTLNTVLDLSMLEAGTLNLEREWIRMEDMVQEKINVFKPVALDKQVDFILDNTLGEAEGYLDRTCMGRVLDHLLDNAIKFTEKGSIRVALSIDDEMLVLSIADTGVGIDRSFQPHLYDEFKQESAGTTRSYEGTGLGLNITKRMVDLMGGTIMVQSEKGKGSTFALWFPMSLVRMPSDRLASSPSMPSAERQKRRILAVEDSMEIEVLLTYILQENYYVDVVKNETALLEKVQDTSYDLVLMDINLGTRRTGIDVMQSLREMPAYASVPIIAMTAYALLEDRDRFLEVGFDGYISKPFTTKELLDIIEQMLETGIRKRLPTFPVNSARA